MREPYNLNHNPLNLKVGDRVQYMPRRPITGKVIYLTSKGTPVVRWSDDREAPLNSMVNTSSIEIVSD